MGSSFFFLLLAPPCTVVPRSHSSGSSLNSAESCRSGALDERNSRWDLFERRDEVESRCVLDERLGASTCRDSRVRLPVEDVVGARSVRGRDNPGCPRRGWSGIWWLISTGDQIYRRFNVALDTFLGRSSMSILVKASTDDVFRLLEVPQLMKML